MLKCSECKNKVAETITTKNDSEVILCEDCHKKIEEQEHPKCKECSKELELPFFSIVDDKIKHCLDCWKAIEKNYREISNDRKDREGKIVHRTLIGYHDRSKEHPTPIKWNEEKNAWCQWGNKTKIIWQPSQEKEKERPENNDKVPEQVLNNQKIPEKEPGRESNRPQEKDQQQPCPKCGETAKHICPTFKMCEVCLNSFDKWTKGELELGIQVYQQNLRGDPNNQIVRQKLIQIQAEYDKRYNKPAQNPKPNPGKRDRNINKEIPKNRQLKPNECCEGCGASCIVNETQTSYTIRRKRYIKHSVNFTSQASIWFGLNCSCIKRFEQENQQTCHQCQKREFPENWVLDYELKMAFCSPMCHVSYREAQWARENQTNQPTQTRPNPTPRPNLTSWARSAKLFPAELELSSGDKKDFDWEKEALKKELLILKEKTKKLEKKTTTKPKTTEEVKLESYFLELCKNTQQQAEQAFEDKYGKAELLSLSSSQEQPKRNYLPLIIGGGLILAGIIGLVVYLAIRKKGGNK